MHPFQHPLVIEHLTWLERHPYFQKDMPKYIEVMKNLWIQWFDMESLGRYQDFSFEKIVNKWYDSDILEYKKLDKVSLKILEREKRLVKGLGTSTLFAFITIGYNEQTITPAAMITMGQKVSDMKYWDTVQMVHEKHRINGIHHHTHFLVTYTEPLFKTKIIQYVHQLVKKHVLTKNNIDVKGSPDKDTRFRDISEFRKYIEGDKTEEKMDCVRKDIEWRKKNNM